MSITPAVREILSWYEADNPGSKANLARILNHGRLGGRGKLLILRGDQGFEHGPARNFAANPAASLRKNGWTTGRLTGPPSLKFSISFLRS